MLTKLQLKKIEDLIRRRMLSFTHEVLGPTVLTQAEISELKRYGLLRANVKNFTGEAHILGKIVAFVKREEAKNISFQKLMLLADDLKPMTQVEKKAIEWAREHTGQYIKGLGDDMVKDVGAAIARTSSSAMRAVQDEVIDAVTNRKIVSELKTALFHAVDDKYRDWQRIATTEMTSAIQNGIYQAIRDEHGPEQLVYKRPNTTACKHCKRIYLEDDGVTPIIFKLTDLEDSNVGKRASDWGPTVGPVHPWCQCQLHMLPEGFEFEKKRVVTKPFTKDGKEYKNGSTISESDYDSLSDSERGHTGYDAVLERTGRESRPTTRKSLESRPISDIDDCVCRY